MIYIFAPLKGFSISEFDKTCCELAKRWRHLSLPSISMVWNRGGEAVLPVIANRSNPKNFLVLNPSSGASGRREISREAVSHVVSDCNVICTVLRLCMANDVSILQLKNNVVLYGSSSRKKKSAS